MVRAWEARPVAHFRILEDEPDQPLIIQDEGPWDVHPTVANDIEAVAWRLVGQGYLLPGRRFFYWDGDHNLTEVLIQDGKFAGLRHVDT